VAAKRNRPFTIDHPIVITFLIFAIIAFVYFAAEVLQPLALALLFSLALTPLSNVFERRGLPRAPSVILALLLVVGALGAVGYVVSQQMLSLAEQVAEPGMRENLRSKLAIFQPKGASPLDKLAGVVSEMGETLDKPGVPTNIQDARRFAPEPEGDAAPEAGADGQGEVRATPREAPPQRVQVVAEPSFQERFEAAVGPWLGMLAVGAVVLILVVFLMISREDLSGRVVQLIGPNRITLTTRSMEELGDRISKYLALLVSYNAAMGAVLALGLFVMHVPYAVAWGALGAIIRFVPYIGPVAAYLLPAIFALANFDTWWQAATIVGVYATLELFMSSFIEPIMYGRTTGVSAVGLLVAIMFWTWLWGPVGMLLATPLTVCLAVLGKYVPHLRVFATLLGEEAELAPDVRFYQRLLALDQDGAVEVIEEAEKTLPRAAIFDTILIPTLSRAERDMARGEIDERVQEFIWRVIGETIDELAERPEIDLEAIKALPRLDTSNAPAASALLGVAANDHSDALALRMLSQLMAQANCPMEVVTNVESPLKLNEAVKDHDPRIVVLSHLPPMGLTPARYLVRRLRAQHDRLPIYVGRWGESGGASKAAERLGASGASAVVFSLAEARLQLLRALTPGAPGEPKSPLPEPVPAGHA
jgi:predicted PurR-regulated permease PerM